jgi:hypothetical protein
MYANTYTHIHAHTYMFAIITEGKRPDGWGYSMGRVDKSIMYAYMVHTNMHAHTHTYTYLHDLYVNSEGKRPDGWGYSMGRVDEWMLSMFMPPPGMHV